MAIVWRRLGELSLRLYPQILNAPYCKIKSLSVLNGILYITYYNEFRLRLLATGLFCQVACQMEKNKSCAATGKNKPVTNNPQFRVYLKKFSNKRTQKIFFTNPQTKFVPIQPQCHQKLFISYQVITCSTMHLKIVQSV